MMNKAKLVKEFANAISNMRKTHEDGTYHWYLGTDENNNYWAIVLGWLDGFEADETDDCMDGTWRLCSKLAYQPCNSLMQCDYDIDWLMPYDEESGEVDDTEIPIYSNINMTNIEEIIDWFLEQYSSYTED